MADRDEGGHVEGASYRSATTHDHAKVPLSRFMGANKSRHLAAIQRTQFREMRNWSRCRTENTAQKVVEATGWTGSRG